jgi:PadR family transcriptional regulator PadR
MGVVDDAGERESLLMRGSLDLCVLALLAGEPTHAYGIVQKLDQHGFHQSGYGTVYPLVTRLRRQGLLSQRQETSAEGPARNMLSLTAEGRAALVRWTGLWRHAVQRVDALLLDAAGDQAGEGCSHAG